MKHGVVQAVLRGAIMCLITSMASVGTANAAEVQVTIDNFAFSPPEVHIKSGDTVTWVNQDDIPHTVVSQPIGTFRSRPLDTDQKYSFQFQKSGSYDYFCSLHPHMKAKIVVSE